MLAGEDLVNVERAVACDLELGLDLEVALKAFPPHDGAEPAWRFAVNLLVFESANLALSVALEDMLFAALAKRSARSAAAGE